MGVSKDDQGKIPFLRGQLVGQAAFSELCGGLELQFQVFCCRSKHFFEHGGAAWEGQSSRKAAVRLRIAVLDTKLKEKDEVPAGLIEKHVVSKEVLG